jgi:hypothetical protein
MRSSGRLIGAVERDVIEVFGSSTAVDFWILTAAFL